MNTRAPVTIDQAPMPVAASPSPMSMLAMAVEKGMDMATIQGLMDLSDRFEATQARKAYVVAMSNFKANPPEILKSKEVNIPGGAKFSHATLADVCDGVCAGLARHGLSHSWETRQEGDKITVTCVITHSMGHSEHTSLSAQPDDSGRKNSIQQVASTVTYLERYTLMAATGLAAKDMDDDGAGAGKPKPGLTDEAYAEFRKKIEATTSKEAAKSAWREGIKACEACGDLQKAAALKTVLLAHGDFIDQAAKAAAK